MIYRLVIDPPQICDRTVTLRSDQQHYLRRVLRLNSGDRFLVMNGTGQVWIAQLEGQRAQLLQELLESTELPTAIALLVALPKGSGFEDIIRCTTELGVNVLIPAIGDRTLLQPSANKVQRWRKIAAEAAEQSERQIVPQIFDPLPFTQALKEAEQFSRHRYICATRREDAHILESLPSPLPPSLV